MEVDAVITGIDRGAFDNIGIRIRALDGRREVFMTGNPPRRTGPSGTRQCSVSPRTPDEPGAGDLYHRGVRLAPRRRPHRVHRPDLDVSHGSSRLADRRLHGRPFAPPRACIRSGEEPRNRRPGSARNEDRGISPAHRSGCRWSRICRRPYPPRHCLVSTRSISCITSPTWRSRSSSSPMERTCRGSGSLHSAHPEESSWSAPWKRYRLERDRYREWTQEYDLIPGVGARRATLLPCPARSLVMHFPYSLESATRRGHGRRTAAAFASGSAGVARWEWKKAFRRIPGGNGSIRSLPGGLPAAGGLWTRR